MIHSTRYRLHGLISRTRFKSRFHHTHARNHHRKLVLGFGLTCLSLGPGAIAPAQAQSAAQDGTPAPGYESQRKNLKTVAMTGMGQIKAAGRGIIGRTVELQGDIKGTFISNGTLAVLFETSDGELLSLPAPSNMVDNPALHAGARPRILAHVDGTMGQTVALSLLNATTVGVTPEVLAIADDPGAPVILTPTTSNRAQAAIVFSNPQPVTRRTQPSLVPRTPVAVAPLANDAGQHSAYKSLAKRFNPRLPEDMADYISSSLLTAASSQNLDPRFLAAVVSVESSFDPYCLSTSGAMGLGQLMPFNLRGLGVSNAWDPMQNLCGAARMLRSNLNRFEGQSNCTLLAVAAYHAGGNAVVRAGHQVPDKVATQRYVWKVYYAYKALAPELF